MHIYPLHPISQHTGNIISYAQLLSNEYLRSRANFSLWPPIGVPPLPAFLWHLVPGKQSLTKSHLPPPWMFHNPLPHIISTPDLFSTSLSYYIFFHFSISQNWKTFTLETAGSITVSVTLELYVNHKKNHSRAPHVPHICPCICFIFWGNKLHKVSLKQSTLSMGILHNSAGFSVQGLIRLRISLSGKSTRCFQAPLHCEKIHFLAVV